MYHEIYKLIHKDKSNVSSHSKNLEFDICNHVFFISMKLYALSIIWTNVNVLIYYDYRLQNLEKENELLKMENPRLRGEIDRLKIVSDILILVLVND